MCMLISVNINSTYSCLISVMMASRGRKLTSDEKSAFLKFVTNSKEAKGFYDCNATNYDDFNQMAGAVLHVVGAREFVKQFNDVTPLEDVRIADIGAGTGRVGQLLKENGYNNLTAFDISSGMLEEAKKKNIYKDHIECDLNEEKMDEYLKKFDHAIGIGCFGFGLIKPHGLDKMASLVKSGGIVCISFREATLASEELGFKQKMEEMEKRRIWKETSCVLDEYINNLPSQEGDALVTVNAYCMIFKVS